MKKICINNAWYSAKTFDEMTGVDWKRITRNYQIAGADLSQVVLTYRAILAIVVPKIVRDLRKWDAVQVSDAMVAVAMHLSDVLQEGSAVHDEMTQAARALVRALDQCSGGAA